MEFDAATAARCGGRDVLADALRQSRMRTLALLDAYVAALGEALVVPYSVQLNPPLWEVGHVAWFQDYWIARSRQRDLGLTCDPDHARPEGRFAGADALYNSSRVAHETRWSLPLPNLAETRDYLAASLDETLALLGGAEESDAGLYFHRLSLFHEDMHSEAAIYMAQALDIAVPDGMLRAAQEARGTHGLRIEARDWRLGWSGTGFAFDNELQSHDVCVAAFEIDSEAVSWARYLPCIEAGVARMPRYLKRDDGGWQCREFGCWRPLDMAAPATHLSWGEAEAWCRWAGRRLPTEAEWEVAALTHPEFRWGDVWEWTASRFEPFPGFEPHPYRDYSAPWFGARYVLRGASRATSARMAHPRYRNYFTPERDDIHMGFRSCAT